MSSILHGTVSGYYRSGCRCDACKTAGTAYAREWREAKDGMTPDQAHGTYGGYVNYSCRCDACRSANAAYKREYRARRRTVR